MTRSVVRWVAVGLALVAALGCGGGGEKPTVAPPPPPPPTPGSIAGTLQLVTESRGLGGAAVTLRRGSGDSLTSVVTDSDGAFRFLSIAAGTYRVGVRLPAGHSADATSDTAQQVTVASGAETTVRLQARPITAVVDTVRAGASDTVSLGNGAWVVVELPAGAAPLVVNVRAAASDSATWGRPTIGATVEVSVPATSGVQATVLQSQSAVRLAAAGGTISFALPVTSPPAAPRQAAVRGLFAISGSLEELDGLIASLSQSVINPLTGAQRWMQVGQVPFSPGQISKLRLAVVASTVACPEQMSMAQDPDFMGTEPLLLLHGIQLQYADCDDYSKYEPARDTFKDMIDALELDPAVRARYALYTFKYPTNHGVLNASTGLASPAFLPKLASRSGSKVTIIAHSMGGLVARQYLRDHTDADIAHVLALATPHLGTAVADAGPTVWSGPVTGCYNRYANAHPVRLPPWYVLLAVNLWVFQDNRDQGLRDLSAAPPSLGTREPFSRIITTFAGQISPPMLAHLGFKPGSVINGTMTLGSCFLGQGGTSSDDGLVPDTSANPRWSQRRLGPFPRDHIQMAGADAQGVNDNFIATIIKLLLPSPIQVTSNVATTWTLAPGGLSGGGTSGTFSVMPAPSGTVYTLSAQALTGRTTTISNSKGGGSAVTVFPGDAVSFTITYSGSPPNAGVPTAPSNLNGVATPGLASLAWSDNSSDEAGFKLERATGTTGSFVEIATTGSGIAAYLDRNVAVGATYSYRVRAYNSAGDSPYSNTSTLTVPGPSNCPAPTVVASSIGRATTWTAGQAGCVHYLVRGVLTVNGALSIGPGTTIAMASGAGLTVFGSINAVGTSASPITIRGERAVRGFWQSIDVRSARSLNELTYVDIRHGGGGASGTRANVSVSSNAQLRVHNATFEESADAGMEVERFGLLPAFSNNRFHNNAGAGLRVPAEEAGALDPASSYSTGNGVPYIDVEGSGLHKTQTWRVTNTPL
ncbi:MAG: carboxypeptidase regulatory-like domain-containing protein, partial [Gemmatimonadaceae bacterium]|nr:carboxypeptidase regulatory-like domain-containing protein [Gemmatimonadaceae bacterium]